jgi:4-hydroxy-tetrahydrodipicolinate synthase
MVGITDTAFVESLDLARYAAAAGADALVLAPPYYLPEGQPELQEYLDHLVAQLPLPVFLYNTPKLTKVQYELGALRRAMDKPRIIGLKDSSESMSYFHDAVALLKHRPDWSLLIGPEELLADALLAGGHGGVPGGANLFPKLYVQLCEATRTGDFNRSRQLHAQVMRISNSLYQIGHHASAVIKGIKCALSCMGICDDFMAEPFHRFRAEERARVQSQLPGLAAGVEKLVSNHEPQAGVMCPP